MTNFVPRHAILAGDVLIFGSGRYLQANISKLIGGVGPVVITALTVLFASGAYTSANAVLTTETDFVWMSACGY